MIMHWWIIHVMDNIVLNYYKVLGQFIHKFKKAQLNGSNQVAFQEDIAWTLWKGICQQKVTATNPVLTGVSNPGQTVCKPGRWSFNWKQELCSPNTKGRSTYLQKVPILVPDCSVFIQSKDPNLHNGPKRSVLIGWNCESWLVIMQMKI